VRQGWHVLEPHNPFVDGLHVHAICLHLQAVSEGRIADLLINVPPGHAKSLITAVFWPAYVWGPAGHPETRFLFSTYKEDLTIRDSVKCRTLIKSPWYQERWGHIVRIPRSQDQKHRFANSETGYRVVVTVGSGTGERADIVVCDDATSVDQAESDTERERANGWWTGTMSTRLNDRRTGHLVGIQQRLNEMDFTGACLKVGGYVHLFLAARFEPENHCETQIWKDPRTKAGELLWPAYLGETELAALEKTLGPYRWAGQYQQRPSPLSGGIFKRHHFQYWQPRGAKLLPIPVQLEDRSIEMRKAVDLPEGMTRIAESWDMGKRIFHQSDDNVAGGKWAAKGEDRYLLHQVCRPMNMAETMQAVEDLAAMKPYAGPKFVELAANGPAIIVALQQKVTGLIGIPPVGSKVARAQACAPEIASGHIFLPHPDIAPWMKAFIEEAAVFPNGAHDDQVDQMSQALHQFKIMPGPVYDVQERCFIEDLLTIPINWPAAFAVTFVGDQMAALWGAIDPQNGTIHITGERLVRTDLFENAKTIREHSVAVGLIDRRTPSRTEAETQRLVQNYRDQKIELTMLDPAPRAGVQHALQLLSRDNLRMFKTCIKATAEWRAYWKDDKGEAPLQGFPLMECLGILALHGKLKMRTRPLPRIPSGGGNQERSWMA
jgi:predicted phage terminase large subunit-like protein